MKNVQVLQFVASPHICSLLTASLSIYRRRKYPGILPSKNSHNGALTALSPDTKARARGSSGANPARVQASLGHRRPRDPEVAAPVHPVLQEQARDERTRSRCGHQKGPGEGVLFVEADANVKLEEFGKQLPPPLPWLSELLYNVPGSDGIIGCPLLLIQVTRLACGGFTLAIRLNHTMSDGRGIAQFLNAVGEMARGEPSPTVHPAWARELLSARNPPSVTHDHREFDTIPESQRTPFPPDEHLVHKSFFFGPIDITTLKKKVLIPCTSFEVLAASLWRARTMALRLDPSDELRFMFAINLRVRMSPHLPAGYYGNAIVYPAVLSTVKKLCESPLSYAVELVKKAKAKATDEYIKSVADLMALRDRPPFAMNGAPRVYLVSDTTRLGFAEVDYGWGSAVYGGPATGGFDALPGVLSFFVAFTNEKGERGTIVTMCLPDDAMGRFAMEVEQLIRAPVNFGNML